MNRNLNLLLALTAGLLGGALSRYITPVLAQAQAPVAKEIQAQSFVLMDDKNRVVGTFKSSSEALPGNPPAVVLTDRNGREIWRAGNSFRVLTEK